MGGEAGQLGHDHAPVLSALRGLDAAQLLDREGAAEVVHRGGDVVGAVRPGDDLGVAVRLAQLLGAAVQVTDHGVAVGDDLAVQLEDDAHHPVGARVLRPHVEDQFALARGKRPLLHDLHGAGAGRVLREVESSLGGGIARVSDWREGHVALLPVQRVRTRGTLRSEL